MKIVFMGTSDFSRIVLKTLLDFNFEISAVFTQPDRPKGRGKKIEISPVKQLALEKNIPVYQPEILRNNPKIFEIIKKIQPDLILVVAYGLFLPQEILNLPKFGCINLHASLLPKYRGASPIQWAILNGEKISGVSIIIMNEKIDEGDIIAEKEIEIKEDETAGELEGRLAKLGAQLLVETLPLVEQNKITRTPQLSKKEKPSYAPLIKKEDGLINWSEPALNIQNKIRAFNPWPSAYSYIRGKYFKILKAKSINYFETSDSKIHKLGEIIKITPEETLVKTGSGYLNILEIQPEGKRAMTPFELSLGRSIKVGDIFSNNR